MPVLKLKDDIDEIDFWAQNNYALISDSLEISMPSKNDIRYASLSGSEDLVSMKYGNRNITFDFYVYGVTQKELTDYISKVTRMVIRNSHNNYISGSGYEANSTFELGNNTGETGMILVARRHDENGPSKKKETGVTEALDLSNVYKIVSSDITVLNRHSSDKRITRQSDINVITNSGFETNATGWSTLNGSSIARSSEDSYVGTYSLKVTPASGSANSGTQTDITTNDGGGYGFSFAFNGVSGVKYNIRIISDVSGAIKLQSFTATGSWQRVGTSFVASGSDHTVRIEKANTGVTGIFYIDDVKAQQKDMFIAQCSMELEAFPFSTGESYVVYEKSSPAFYSRPLAPVDTSKIPFAVIDKDDILGDVPALTRISTKINNGAGIIVGRDAGYSLLRSPGYPDATVTNPDAENAISIYGQIPGGLSTLDYYRIRVKSAGSSQLEYSTDDGSNYSGTIAFTVGTPVDIGSTGIKAVVHDASNLTTNDYWRFIPHQVSIPTEMSAVQVGTSGSNQDDLYSKDGVLIAEFYVAIPYGVKSRYRMYAVMTATGEDIARQFEVSAAINYFSRGIIYTEVNGSPNMGTHIRLDWTTAIRIDSPISTGNLDLTPRASGFTGHPNSISVAKVSIYARALDVISTSSVTLNCPYLYLIPYQDENSFLHILWSVQPESGHEVYSNYDPSNQYFGVATGDAVGTNEITSISSLNETHMGNCITLIPGADNTLVFLPLKNPFNTAIDTAYWRRGLIAHDINTHTGPVTVAVKPRYLYGE